MIFGCIVKTRAVFKMRVFHTQLSRALIHHNNKSVFTPCDMLCQCGAGIVLGLLASWAVLANLQNIVEWLARMGLEVFPASVYGLAAIPHRLIVSDIFWVVALVFVFGLLASFIPALAAAMKDPVKALNQ